MNWTLALEKVYSYALWGAVDKLKTLEKLRGMCLDVMDGDAADEYEKIIFTTKEDIKYICDVLECDYESAII